ncbi:unnamed protein product [Sympodiomycopsis kandeliae]
MYIKLTLALLALVAVGSAYADLGTWYYYKDCDGNGIPVTSTAGGKVIWTAGVWAIRPNKGVSATIYDNVDCTGTGKPVSSGSCASFPDSLIFCFQAH